MRISTIKMNDVANGPGIRLSVYTQGCPHCCKGCFNQETWNPNGGREFDRRTREQIYNGLLDTRINRHLSILGGEPLAPYNIEGVLDLAAGAKAIKPEINIWLWTGYELNADFFQTNQMIEKIDVIVDGRFEEDKKDLKLKWRGSSNQRIIDVKETIKQEKIIEKKEFY